jgi:hypothetical protein
MINKLISDQVQEHLHLEYKGAGALQRDDKYKTDITIDVSAMANSDGGTIIYGVREYTEREKRHLPEKIDPLNQVSFSKEWLEQVINTIRPRINGIIITPITLNDIQVIYIVDIPKSDTAHQARDDRYHKRNNFTISNMEDHEIRDVMNRNKNPKLVLSFSILRKMRGEYPCFSLVVKAENAGGVYAKYVNIFIRIPYFMLSDQNRQHSYDDSYIRQIDNTVRDSITEHSTAWKRSDGLSLVKVSQGPSRYDPILPGLSREWSIELGNLLVNPGRDFSIHDKLCWEIYADNAIPISGEYPLNQTKIEWVAQE